MYQTTIPQWALRKMAAQSQAEATRMQNWGAAAAKQGKPRTAPDRMSYPNQQQWLKGYDSVK